MTAWLAPSVKAAALTNPCPRVHRGVVGERLVGKSTTAGHVGAHERVEEGFFDGGADAEFVDQLGQEPRAFGHLRRLDRCKQFFDVAEVAMSNRTASPSDSPSPAASPAVGRLRTVPRRVA